MVVTGFVIAERPLLNTLLRNLKCNMNFAVGSVSLRRHDAKFNRIQGMSCIPAGKLRKEIHSGIVNHRVIGTHASVTVINRLPD